MNVLYDVELFIELFINSKYENKCFIIISDMDDSESIITVLNIAKNYKIPLVCITDNEYSNLVNYSHVFLKIISSVSGNPFKSFNIEISL
ncbi:hypothetical protein [Spiroplasma endosymbiont of Labia minor]|uniref:hypothetical protein n=1 Tax=Spiroplasma endosymbiont of Labia minor TaxID=3066305 RepID=UPI0030D49685